MPLLAVDALLALVLVIVAVRVLMVADLFEAVVLFIVFGVLMAVAWARLHAVDVALAEAAIGAGFSGALLIGALAHTHGRARAPAIDGARPGRWAAVLVIVLGLSAAALAIQVVRALPPTFAGLGPTVSVAMGESGVGNPVTAVLLNFRAFDTLLEVVVLFAVVVGVWSLGATGSGPVPERAADRPGAVLTALVRLLVPVVIVVAGHLLWAGTSAPGGAFQAGAVLGAAGVLLHASGAMSCPTLHHWGVRAAVAGGLVVFLAVAVGVQTTGRAVLEYPRASAGTLILIVEAAVTVSIAAILVALYVGGAAPRRDDRTRLRGDEAPAGSSAARREA